MKRLFLVCLLMGVLLATAASPAAADNAPNTDVFPPGATVHGRTYAEWSARWWQWALTLLDSVFQALRAEYADNGKAELFDRLDEDGSPYASLSREERTELLEVESVGRPGSSRPPTWCPGSC